MSVAAISKASNTWLKSLPTRSTTVAQGLRAFRQNDWVDALGHGQTTVTVVVKNPEVQHKVVQDLSAGSTRKAARTPAEVSLKIRLRELLGREASRTSTAARIKPIIRNNGRPKS
jgi:hypothetical protein